MLKSYTDLIDQALLKRQAEDTSTYFPLRPSAAGYNQCRLAYDLAEYMGFVKDLPREVKEPQTIRLLSLGSSVEWQAIKNFELISKANPDVKIKYKQQAVSLFRLKHDGRLIEGSIDYAIQDGEFLDIYDSKSKNDKHSQAFKTKWDEDFTKFSNMKTLEQFGETSFFTSDLPAFLEELKDPFFEHNFHQVNAYCGTAWFKEHNGRHGGIYRYNKNDSRHLEIRFQPSAEMFEELEEKFNYIYTTVMETQDPAKVKKACWLGSPVTAFSRCKDTCWKEDALKAYFKTFPKKEWPTDVRGNSELGKLFAKYEELNTYVEQQEAVENEILKITVEEELNKVKLSNSNVYEIKYLKSDKKKPFHLRRSKV